MCVCVRVCVFCWYIKPVWSGQRSVVGLRSYIKHAGNCKNSCQRSLEAKWPPCFIYYVVPSSTLARYIHIYVYIYHKQYLGQKKNIKQIKILPYTNSLAIIFKTEIEQTSFLIGKKNGRKSRIYVQTKNFFTSEATHKLLCPSVFATIKKHLTLPGELF